MPLIERRDILVDLEILILLCSCAAAAEVEGGSCEQEGRPLSALTCAGPCISNFIFMRLLHFNLVSCLNTLANNSVYSAFQMW